MRLREGDQQLPTPNDEPFIHDEVAADILDRKRIGIERYGTPLQPFNGRDSSRDLYEELLDAAVYVKTLSKEFSELKKVISTTAKKLGELKQTSGLQEVQEILDHINKCDWIAI